MQALRTVQLHRFAVLATVLLCAVTTAGASDIDELARRKSESSQQYQVLNRAIELSRETLDELASEIAALKKDSVTITGALIQAAKTEKKLNQDIEDIEARLTVLQDREAIIRRSLAERKNLLAEVLAALQRMGLSPPPAILVTPEDALSSVRSAILLGAVVPEIRTETQILTTDLKELGRVNASIAAERDRLSETVLAQHSEKERLTLLLREKKLLQRQSEQSRSAERDRAEALAQKAGSLKELITALETQITSVRQAEEESRRAARQEQKKAEEAQQLAQKEREDQEARMAILRERAAALSPDASRIGPSTPFSAMRGKLTLPVSGRVIHHYGEENEITGNATGDTVATQSGATVTSPSDGTVLYAGKFRSYGQLLILDVQDDYHVVLAGMAKIDVEVGQSVLAGEPVGAMGETRLASTGQLDSSKTQPTLYIEFRREGKPIDPALWWSGNLSGRTGNDS